MTSHSIDAAPESNDDCMYEAPSSTIGAEHRSRILIICLFVPSETSAYIRLLPLYSVVEPRRVSPCLFVSALNAVCSPFLRVFSLCLPSAWIPVMDVRGGRPSLTSMPRTRILLLACSSPG